MIKKIFSVRVLTVLTLIAFVLSAVYIAVLRFLPEAEHRYNILARSDFEIIFLTCLAGIAALFFPAIVRKFSGYTISNTMMAIYVAFIFGSMFLGSIMNLYYRIFHWDTFLHLLSGITLGILGYAIADIVEKTHKTKYNAMFVTIFAFCFASAMGVLWEIYEFAIDSIAGSNTQRWADAYGVPFVGQAALFDTMKDLIANKIGAVAVCIWGYMRLKRKDWPQSLTIARIK